MACNEKFTRMIEDFLWGELDAAEQDGFRKHLAECSDCRETFEAHDILHTRLESAAERRPALPVDFATRVAAAALIAEKPARTGWRLAAVCAVILVSAATIALGGLFVDYTSILESAGETMLSGIPEMPDAASVMRGAADIPEDVFGFASEWNLVSSFENPLLFIAAVLGVAAIAAGASAFRHTRSRKGVCNA